MQVVLSLLDEQLVYPAAEDNQSMIHMTTEGGDRHVHMVNDILELERLESGKLRLLYAPLLNAAMKWDVGP